MNIFETHFGVLSWHYWEHVWRANRTTDTLCSVLTQKNNRILPYITAHSGSHLLHYTGSSLFSCI
jgi:hypothetical protein